MPQSCMWYWWGTDPEILWLQHCYQGKALDDVHSRISRLNWVMSVSPTRGALGSLCHSLVYGTGTVWILGSHGSSTAIRGTSLGYI